MSVELYPHQTKAVEEMHNGCVLRGGVGTGKSITTLAYYFTRVCGGELRSDDSRSWAGLKEPRDVYVITTAKKRDDRDWEREAAAFGISTARGSSVAPVQIKVDSWNNIANYKEVKDAFFIFDEQRLVGSGAWVKAFIKIAKANKWVLLSATPGDSWMDYVPVFVANGFYKNRTEFLRRHVVYNNFSKFPKVDHYVETARLQRLRRLVLVEMPYTRHTKRHLQFAPVSFDRLKFDRIWKDRWHIFEERPLKDVGEMFRVGRKLVNSDLSRYANTMELLEKHPRLIVFYNFNYERDMLKVLASSVGVPIGEWNGHNHDEIPGTERWLYIVQYTAGAEGWNCVSTDAIAFWSLTYSYKQFEQSQGRIDRLNTRFTDLWYYVFKSDAPVDKAIWASLSAKENFNETKYAKSWSKTQI